MDYPAKKGYKGHVAAEYDSTRTAKWIARLRWNREFILLGEFIRLATGNGNTVLDAPVGTGRFQSLFENLGYKVIGVDVSSDMLQIAKDRKDGEKKQF